MDSDERQDSSEECSRAGDGSDEEQEVVTGPPQTDSDEGSKETLGRPGRGCVYFIETHDGVFVKIGFSKNVPKRLDGFGVLMPGLRLIGSMPGSEETERWLHANFSDHRERGEWFRQTDEIRRFIIAMGLIRAAINNPPEAPAILDSGKNPVAIALGRKGGKARAAAMTPEERSDAASKAVKARWEKSEKERAKAKKAAKKAKRPLK